MTTSDRPHRPSSRYVQGLALVPVIAGGYGMLQEQWLFAGLMLALAIIAGAFPFIMRLRARWRSPAGDEVEFGLLTRPPSQPDEQRQPDDRS